LSPSADRWRPRRAGIINLYEYADQVFDFAGGRLLLRGHNTSGKTKALELLLPFCLDGDISPVKLDPFASAYKEMKWNLIGCCDAEKRIGYVWLEFERLEPAGATRRLTVGIGMRANRDLPNVVRWYFVARNRSVGHDLMLLRGREPIGKADLAAALGDDGEVLDSQRDYRARLNDLLFGFTGEEQYQTMLRLMRDLRRPHLSKTLDPARVAEQLTVGLPEIDQELVRRLASGLEQLETLERGLERLRDVRERVRRFHQRTYSAYARAVVRERADGLRQASSAVEAAAERLRDVRAELEARSTEAERAGAERDAARAECNRLSAEEHALISSAAWSSVAEVETLRELAAGQTRAAGAARERADHAASAAGALEAELITARAAAQERRATAEGDLDAVVKLGTQAGLAGRVETLAGQLRDGTVDAQSWSPLLRHLATDWRDVLHRHRHLLAEARAATASAERARAQLRVAAERLEQADATRTATEDQLEDAREAFRTTLAHWRETLVELALSEEHTEMALRLAFDGQPAAPAVADAVERVRTELSDLRSARVTARDGAHAAIATLNAEIERLAAAHDDGPRAPEWTRSDRDGRPGAPLWRLVDFRDGESASAQAGLEAALEASGLLDAWITPSGTLEDPSLADVLAHAGPALDHSSLLDALAPVPDQPVAPEVTERLLGSIALGARDGEPWLDRDGGFRLGPLHGRGAKASAEHVGAAAREARRAQQIAQRRATINERQTEIAALDAEIGVIDTRRATADRELESLPPIDAIASAIHAARLAVALEAEAARTHDAAAAGARETADAEIAADAARREHAVDHDLPASLDERALDEFSEAAISLAAGAITVARAWSHAEREAAAAETIGERLAESQSDAAEQQDRARGAESEAERLTAEHAAREAALGATGEEVRRRHAEVVGKLRRSRESERRSGETAQQALIAVAGLERDAAARAEDHTVAHAAREQASVAFRQLAEVGILQSVLEDAAPADSSAAAGWTFTRSLEVARALPAALLEVRSTSGEREVEVQRAVQLLDRELADADMGAYATRGETGLLIVEVAEGGAAQTLAETLETLAAEIADREQILTAEERRVFSDALVEELADHLRHRIHDVHGLVERMNAVLRQSPTAAGKTVELEWRPSDSDQGTERTALALLRRDVRRLDGDARGELIAFFRARIESARRDHSSSGEPRAMAETLLEAFDYRRWFAFGMHERTPTGRVRLSRQRHAVGSGGEQSVLIHLPLFAAAAALYGDSHAPRLIMLDEALSGIDDETRERVLKATVDFDLDLMMTSHELWGTYASVPQLAIYQLHRDNGAVGVHAIPFVWDGAILRELDQGALLV
jgi:uncharacterized protein (TIGR02680 family)